MENEQAPASTQAIDPKPEESPLVRAGKVSKIVRLESIRMLQFSARALADATEMDVDEIEQEFGFTRPTVGRKSATSLAISSTLVFSIRKPTAEGEEQPDPIASLRATIELLYSQRADAEISDEDLQHFANMNAPFNSWGYWREFVQSSVARLGVTQVITLPLFRVQAAEKWMLDDQD